jgi:hypothetical protein
MSISQQRATETTDEWQSKTITTSHKETPIAKAIEQLRIVIESEEHAATKAIDVLDALLHSGRATNLRKTLRQFEAAPEGCSVHFYRYGGQTRLKFITN